MATKTKERLYDTADTMKPYVDRALHDDDLHDNLKEAFKAARDVYAELLGNRNLTGTAMRAATDKDIQDNLKKAVEELRTAANRIQGKEDHGARNTMLLLAGITDRHPLQPDDGAPDPRLADGEGHRRGVRRLHLHAAAEHELVERRRRLASSRRREPCCRPGQPGRAARGPASPGRGRSRSRCPSNRAGSRPDAARSRSTAPAAPSHGRRRT